MHSIKQLAAGLHRDSRGQTMTEYGLILAAVAIVAVVAYSTLGTTISTLVNNVVKCL